MSLQTHLPRHYDPLRPHRFVGVDERYEFAHGGDSLCVYDIATMDFVKKIPIGKRPDCHSTSWNNRYLYLACEDGLYCIDQDSLEVARVLDIGHVFATNVMPDRDTLFVHDAYGGFIVIKGIEDMESIHVHKRVDVLGTNKAWETLGGKGHFLENDRFYIVAGWDKENVYSIDLESDYAPDLFASSPLLKRGDDLVISTDKSTAFIACYNTRDESYISVMDLASKEIIMTVPSGGGTCGLTMSNDERYVAGGNDQEDSLFVMDSQTFETRRISVRAGLEKLGIEGYIQGTSVGQNDEFYVYGCSGSGALAKVWNIAGEPQWMVSCPSGKVSSEECQP